MKLGVHTASLHDGPLAKAHEVIASLGLDAAEINARGFLPPVRIRLDDVIASRAAAADYLAICDDRGVALAGLSANGDPLHPNPAIGERHAADLRRAIRAADALEQTRVVTTSGLTGGEPGSTVPNWIVNAWSSGSLARPQDSAWDFVALGRGHAVDFWTRSVEGLRAAAEVLRAAAAVSA